MGSLVALHIIELDLHLTNKDLLPTIPVEPYQGPQGDTVDVLLGTWASSFLIISCVEHLTIS
jgi:hypothetical protein